MDPLLLKYYERELQFIREMGAEYAREFPKIAGRLGLDGIETADPYVERLYEGFAFLAARIQLRIDSEYPRFTQNLLNIVYPQYLTPIPSMTVVQFQSDPKASLDAGVNIPRDTSLKAVFKKGEQTSCEFRTSHNVVLWPIKISEAEYFSNVGSFSKIDLQGRAKPKAGLRIRLASTIDQPFNELLLDSLVVYLSGQGGQAMRLYEQIFGNACALVIRSTEKPSSWTETLGPASIIQVGFADDEALLPDDNRTFSGYRLLREYFSFPDRFMFAKFSNLGRAVERCQGQELDLIVLFDRYDPELENRVTPDDFALNCTPAVNLFPKRADRIHISQADTEYHIVPDRTRPMDFEVFQVNGVVGFGTNTDEEQVFLPFYAFRDFTDFPQHMAFFTIRRQRRLLSSKQHRRGPRSSYIGDESYISLVDINETPFSSSLKQLEVQTLCTNRDLPLQMPTGKGNTDFDLLISAPISSVRSIKGPTRPKPSLAHFEGQSSWRLINQLSVNYLSLVDSDESSGASTLRELLKLYADANDATLNKQIEGLRSVKAKQVTRRMPLAGPIAFGRGLKITVTFDESAFVGSGIFLIGSVLEHFFSRYVSINSFTETAIRSTDRGEVMTWPARIGQRQIV